MRLSLHTDYALRTLMYLASQRGRCHVADVAGFFRISKDHVAKVVQRLAHEGLVRSVRGVGGGIELARSPDTIRLGDVIERFEGGLHLLDCVKIEDVCVIQPHCRLKHVLAEAERIQFEFLNSQTLADVVRTTPELHSLTAIS